MWEVFEFPNFAGMSVVLGEGQYQNMETVPFGDNHMSSARKVTNVDVPRQTISGKHGASEKYNDLL